MEHPKDVGDRTQLAVMLALRDAGYAVLVPFGENTRYDLVIDDRKSLARVQCKTGRLRNGAVKWATCSSYAHHPHPKARKVDYQGEVDFFAVFCRDTQGVYLVPIDDVPTATLASIRVERARNNQRRFVRDASKYEIARVSLRRARAKPAATAGAPAPCA
jgi:hypothetical protein